jgi:hypothetical protein
MMKHIWVIALIIGLMACSSEITPEEQASLAAKGYYTHLVAGEYEKFLEGKLGGDSLPDDYREQLLTGYRQFMAQQERAHKGIREVLVSNAKTDSLAGYTSVFLILCYGDSIDEEIVVPMVNHQGRWRMK